MFDVGFWEVLFIALLAHLVLGPEKLPRIVSTLGNWAGRARFMARSLRMQEEQELAREVETRERKTREAAKPAPTGEGDERTGKG
jgi:sec-independent protein translocase protein TatB